MSDLASEPVQEPHDVTNLGPALSVKGVSDEVGSCFDSAQTSTAVTSPLSTTSPDLECVTSEQDALKSEESDAATDSSVSKGLT